MDPQIIIDRISLWRPFRNGMCNGCWSGCCTLPVEITASDLVRMELIFPDDVSAGSLKKIARSLMKAGIVKSYRASTGIFTLQQRHGRDCIYLDNDRLCKIYEKRPEVCRKFPTAGPRPGYCPCLPKEGIAEL